MNKENDIFKACLPFAFFFLIRIKIHSPISMTNPKATGMAMAQIFFLLREPVLSFSENNTKFHGYNFLQYDVV